MIQLPSTPLVHEIFQAIVAQYTYEGRDPLKNSLFQVFVPLYKDLLTVTYMDNADKLRNMVIKLSNGHDSDYYKECREYDEIICLHKLKEEYNMILKDIASINKDLQRLGISSNPNSESGFQAKAFEREK